MKISYKSMHFLEETWTQQRTHWERENLDYLESSIKETGLKDPKIMNEDYRDDLMTEFEKTMNAEPGESMRNKECLEMGQLLEKLQISLKLFDMVFLLHWFPKATTIWSRMQDLHVWLLYQEKKSSFQVFGF